MGLERGIEFGKEHRKPYRKSKRFDRTCRNHGACSYCRANRTHFDEKRRNASEYDLKNWEDDIEDEI